MQFEERTEQNVSSYEQCGGEEQQNKTKTDGRKKDSWINIRKKKIYSRVNISGETNGTRKQGNKEKRERANILIDIT